MAPGAAQRILLVANEQERLDALGCALGDLSRAPQSPAQAAAGCDAAESTEPSQFDSAQEGAEALSRTRQALVDRSPYWLAVVDLHGSASWDGPETAQRLAEADPELMLLLVRRGGPGEELSERLREVRRLILVSENWNPSELRQLAAVQLDRRQQREGLRRTRLELDATRRTMERTREEAEEAERIKSEWLANVSHEIRTPMNAILGFTRLLMKEHLTQEQLEKLRYVYDAADSLMSLIESVLDFSELSAGRLQLEKSGFHLHSMVRDAIDAVRPAADSKGLTLQCQIDPLPGAWLCGDVHRFREVLVHLLGNAVKFTERGTVQVRIAVDEAKETAATLRVAVTDTGIGIPWERQARVFDSFSQVDGSTTRCFGGVGLGLAVSKLLVELMGGQIGFRSEPGQGSSFWFTLPVGIEQAPQREGSEPQPSPALHAPASDTSAAVPDDAAPRQIRILVAEDDRLDRLLLEVLLTRTGCLVDLVSNGREAMAAFTTHVYELAFLDVELPDGEGLMAVRRFRQEETGTHRRLKIVAMTSTTGPAVREQCMAAGADECLVKPLTADALLGAVDRCLPGLLDGVAEEGGGAADAAASEPPLPGALADCVDRLRRALRLPDFREIETQALAARHLAARAGSHAVADHTLRVQLAARRGDLSRASAAVERLDRAIGRCLASSQRHASTRPLRLRQAAAHAGPGNDADSDNRQAGPFPRAAKS